MTMEQTKPYAVVRGYSQVNQVIQNDTTIYSVGCNGSDVWTPIRTITITPAMINQADTEIRGMIIRWDAAGPGLGGQMLRLFVNGVEQTPMNTDEANYPTYTANVYQPITITAPKQNIVLQWQCRHTPVLAGNHYMKNIYIEGRWVLFG
jgi:hypothetical protein